MRDNIKSSKGKVKKKSSSKNIIKSDYILLGILILLIFVVIGLGTGVYYKKREVDNALTASIVLPMLKSSDQKSFSIDVSSLVSEGKYIFKVSNFRGDIISDEDINYSITINKEDNIKVKVSRNKDENNLISEDNNSVKIENNLMKKKSKEFDYYTITLLEYSDIKDDEKIGIIINS